jgi:hypothetical protein
MLFRTRFHEPIRRGEVTCTVRRWKRPQAKVGGVYRLHSGGAIEVTAVDVVPADEVTNEVARAAGFEDGAALLGEVDRASGGEGDLYLVRFRYAGEITDERAELAADDDLDAEAIEALIARLDRMDAGHAWTRETLRLIAGHEGTRAADLARSMGRETQRFKTDVRRLKALGLTESLEVGYRLSPRGRALLAALGAPGGTR